MIHPIQSATDRSNALDYLTSHLHGSLLFSYLPEHVLFDECLGLEMVGAENVPNLDYRHGWGGKAATANEWLEAELVNYLHGDPDNMGMIEDACATPTDPGLTAGAAGPVWSYQNRVLWPIDQKMANRETVAKALSWGLTGRRQVIAFGKSPAINQNFTPVVVTERQVSDFAKSIRVLVIDVFDGEGYLLWQRKARKKK
jgi:hypothetical protein